MHLRGKRCVAAIDDTVSSSGLQDMGWRAARANAAQNVAHDDARVGGLACTLELHAQGAAQQDTAAVIGGRYHRMTDEAQHRGAPIADHVLGVKNIQCGRGGR